MNCQTISECHRLCVIWSLLAPLNYGEATDRTLSFPISRASDSATLPPDFDDTMSSNVHLAKGDYFSPKPGQGTGTGTPSSRQRAPTTSSFREIRLTARNPKDQTMAHNEDVLPEQIKTDKTAEESFYVDNDYYSLNPWTIIRPGEPFPRTVRPGMLWGREGAQKQQDERGSDGQPYVGPPIEVLDEHGQDPGPPPDIFITDINGYPAEVRRVGSREADREEEQGVERQDHYDTEQSQECQSTDSGPRKNYASGYQGGLSPVHETDTASIETSETQEEKQEAQSREQQALQVFYNNYRNPLARLRARFPEAPAEFVATTIYIFFGIAGNLYSITYLTSKGDYPTQAWA
ncbi:hypothetical protein K458DRAFT_426557 [Lentithecium fluviatile CBS 122367]|uniref:Uncharacterized protein n=1 Tax=Lentithecium fluviatile CBS 122367 TaxID=1168545 RepID=A0A6G1JLU7_9PLEO|nr:hypothetical protein K458DRAFT_426557 [Lentithecium fluviatile CBS 122367]